MFQTVSIGPVVLHGYGLILGIAMVAGWWWADRLWRRRTHQHIHFDVMAVWAVVGGVIGARTYHVVDYWWYYQFHLLEIMAVWQGGLAIWGAIGGGIVSLLLLSRWKHLSLRLGLDVFAMALPLSQAIGRWGNWINFELYGKPTTFFWGWWIPPQLRPENMAGIAYYHPLFLYESLLSLGLFLVMNYWGKQWMLGSGKGVATYLIGYGSIRFLLEPLRLVVWRVEGISVAQAISVGAIVVGMILRFRVGLDYEKETSPAK